MNYNNFIPGLGADDDVDVARRQTPGLGEQFDQGSICPTSFCGHRHPDLEAGRSIGSAFNALDPVRAGARLQTHGNTEPFGCPAQE